MTQRHTTIVLLSGGIDSTTLMYLARAAGQRVIALGVEYEQRHVIELDHADDLAKRAGAVFVDTSATIFGLSALSASAAAPAVPDVSADHPDTKVVVVPGRNAIFLSLATSLAIQHGARSIGFATHAGDAAMFPDCRPDFVDTMSRAIRTGYGDQLDPNFDIWAPFLHWSKSDIIREAVKLGVPLELTWSCYRGHQGHAVDEAQCGTCGACRGRQAAFLEAGVKDHTRYLSELPQR